jgi:hypothetical protein
MRKNPYAKLFVLIILSCAGIRQAHADSSVLWPSASAINAIDRSSKAPALAAFRGRLFMVWNARDDDNRIYIATSWDGGIHWARGHRINSIDATPETPALVASIDKLYIAFKANDDSHRIRITVTAEPNFTWPISHEINSLSSTEMGPSLLNFNGHICVAWAAEGTHLLNFVQLDDVSATGLGHSINTEDRSRKSPSLASWHGRLYLAWKSLDESNQILIASSRDGITWSESKPINAVDSTPESPVLLGTRYRLYLVFKANDSSNKIYLTSTVDPAADWMAASTINDADSTPFTPAVTSHRNKLFMAWRANDPTNLLYLTSSYAQESELYFKYLGTYPADANPGWHDEAQGLAHDHQNWFVTRRDSVWRIPLGLGLEGTRRGAIHKNLSDYPALWIYHHFGDPDYVEVDGRGYVVVPLQQGNLLTPFDCELAGPVLCARSGVANGIALFNAEDLQFVAHAFASQADMSWCAIDPRGRLYATQEGRTDTILVYEVNWRELISSAARWGRPGPLSSHTYSLRAPTSIRLASPLSGIQGGEITPTGELLYMVADGIKAIDLATGQILIESSNGHGIFNFEYDVRKWPHAYEEPEGLTIWDLDDGREPGVRGQLHVLILDNDAGSADEIYIKHYGIGPVDRRLDDCRAWTVRGTVIDADRHPIDADITVFLRQIEVGHVRSRSGSFQLCEVPRGRYRIVATSPGHGRFEGYFSIADGRPWELQFR